MDINDFLDYADYFSSQQYDKYYTDDIILELPTRPLSGKAEVKEYYENFNQYIHETLRVKKVLIDGNAIAAHIFSDFYCIQDWQDFPIRPVKKKDLVRLELFAFYTLRDEKFSHIKTARVKVWQAGRSLII